MFRPSKKQLQALFSPEDKDAKKEPPQLALKEYKTLDLPEGANAYIVLSENIMALIDVEKAPYFRVSIFDTKQNQVLHSAEVYYLNVYPIDKENLLIQADIDPGVPALIKWNIKTNEKETIIKTPGPIYFCSIKKGIAAFGYQNSESYLLDIHKKQVIPLGTQANTFGNLIKNIRSVHHFPDNDDLFVLFRNGRYVIWGATSKKNGKVIGLVGEKSLQCILLPNHKVLMQGESDLYLLDLSDKNSSQPNILNKIKLSDNTVSTESPMLLLPDKTIACLFRDNQKRAVICLLDLDTQTFLKQLIIPESPMSFFSSNFALNPINLHFLFITEQRKVIDCDIGLKEYYDYLNMIVQKTLEPLHHVRSIVLEYLGLVPTKESGPPSSSP